VLTTSLEASAYQTKLIEEIIRDDAKAAQQATIVSPQTNFRAERQALLL